MNESAVDSVVIVTLRGLGLCPAPGKLHCTFALCEGRLVARKFLYEGGYAVWAASRGTVNFYDDDGKLLETVALERRGGDKAA